MAERLIAITEYLVRTCAFCDQTPVTREHVFPFWLGEALGAGGGVTNYMTDGSSEEPAIGEPPVYKREWRASEPDIVARCVCRDCNSGWMNDLDVAVQPPLAPLVGGGLVSLADKDRQLIAAWAAKTLMVLEHTRRVSDLTRRRPLVPPSVYRELFDLQLPPSSAQVWLGQVRPLASGAIWRTAPVPLAWVDPTAARFYGAPNGSLGTLVLGGALFQILFAPLTHHYIDFAQRRTAYGTQFMRFLWPPRTPLDWPPPKALDLTTLDFITR